MTRTEMILSLVDYQMDCVYQCEDYQTRDDVLRGIFRRGFTGFDSMTDEELYEECLDANIIDEEEE